MSSDHLLVPPRPSSSLSSSRPISRASQRTTRSQYHVTRQARITPWLKTLVKQVTGLEEEYSPDDFQNTLNVAVKHIERLNQSSLPDISQIDARINGHVEKARVSVQDALADSLQKAHSKVRESRHPSFTISSTVSAVVELLLHLSSAPSASTLAYAASIPQREDLEPQRSRLTWEKILSEEPFEGQHWQGAYGLPRGSTLESWGSGNSELDASSGESDEYEFNSPPSDSMDSSDNCRQTALDSSSHAPLSTRNESLFNRVVTENLCDIQYWNKVKLTPHSSFDSHFDFDQPWTLGPTSDKILQIPSDLEYDTIWIKELDVIREILFLLQGLPSILFTNGVDIIEVETHRRIPHLTHAAQMSILNVFASLATIIKPLRSSAAIFKPDCSPTFQAFMTGVAQQIQQFDAWCSNLETQLLSRVFPPKNTTFEVISLLQLQYRVETRTSHIFQDLLSILRPWESRPPTTRFPCQIINMLWQCLKERQTTQDEVTAQALWQVLRTTTEPLWLNVGRWLKDGIPIDLGLEEGESRLTPTWNVEELFIRINPLIDAAAPDFWEAKYTLKRSPSRAESVTENPVPLFLLDIANDILAAGKAIGLIRAMGLYPSLESNWIECWDTFETVTNGTSHQAIDFHLKEIFLKKIVTPCRLAQATLSRVLVHESHLWEHIQNVEAICLMTKGDLMDQFAEQLFIKMDSSRFVWHDYHSMNAAFRSVAKTDQLINPALVTFNYKSVRDRKLAPTIEAMEGLTVEYAVPFPLVYLFGSESSMSYSKLFCFLLQIRRAKFVLDQISLNTVNAQFLKQRPFLMTFYLIKWRLSWFINTLSSFIKMHVIDVAVRELHEALPTATSLDEMINLHQLHLERLLTQLFIQENTSTLHRAILSVLNLCLRLNDCLTSYKASDSNNIRSTGLFKSSFSRYSLRRMRKKLDVIGFVETLPAVSTTNEDESEDESSLEETDIENSEFMANESNISEQVEYISAGMMRLIDIVRREVQILATGITDAAEVFGILAFLLEEG